MPRGRPCKSNSSAKSTNNNPAKKTTHREDQYNELLKDFREFLGNEGFTSTLVSLFVQLFQEKPINPVKKLADLIYWNEGLVPPDELDSEKDNKIFYLERELDYYKNLIESLKTDGSEDIQDGIIKFEKSHGRQESSAAGSNSNMANGFPSGITIQILPEKSELESMNLGINRGLSGISNSFLNEICDTATESLTSVKRPIVPIGHKEMKNAFPGLRLRGTGEKNSDESDDDGSDLKKLNSNGRDLSRVKSLSDTENEMSCEEGKPVDKNIESDVSMEDAGDELTKSIKLDQHHIKSEKSESIKIKSETKKPKSEEKQAKLSDKCIVKPLKISGLKHKKHSKEHKLKDFDEEKKKSKKHSSKSKENGHSKKSSELKEEDKDAEFSELQRIHELKLCSVKLDKLREPLDVKEQLKVTMEEKNATTVKETEMKDQENTVNAKKDSDLKKSNAVTKNVDSDFSDNERLLVNHESNSDPSSEKTAENFSQQSFGGSQRDVPDPKIEEPDTVSLKTDLHLSQDSSDGENRLVINTDVESVSSSQVSTATLKNECSQEVVVKKIFKKKVGFDLKLIQDTKIESTEKIENSPKKCQETDNSEEIFENLSEKLQQMEASQDSTNNIVENPMEETLKIQESLKNSIEKDSDEEMEELAQEPVKEIEENPKEAEKSPEKIPKMEESRDSTDNIDENLTDETIKDQGSLKNLSEKDSDEEMVEQDQVKPKEAEKSPEKPADTKEDCALMRKFSLSDCLNLGIDDDFDPDYEDDV